MSEMNAKHTEITLDGKIVTIMFFGDLSGRVTEHTTNELMAKSRVSGAPKLETMLRSAMPITVYTMTTNDFEIFIEQADKIFYASMCDRDHETDIFDVFVRASDSNKVNELIEQSNMAHLPREDVILEVADAEKQSESNTQPPASSQRRYSIADSVADSITDSNSGGTANNTEDEENDPRPDPWDYKKDGKLTLRPYIEACRAWRRRQEERIKN